MIRKFPDLRCKMLINRAVVNRLNSQCGMATGLMCRKKPQVLSDGVVVASIKMQNLGKVRLDSRRSFVTSQMLLEKEHPFVPKKPETKGQSSPEATADAEGTQAPTASDGDGPSDSTTKFSMARLANSLLSRNQSGQALNIHDLGTANMEFRRSFMTSQMLLEKEHPFVPKKPVTSEDAKGQSSPEATADAEGTQAPTASDDDGPSDSTVNSSSVVDLDGNPIHPIEIDGWNQDGESDPTVQNSTHVDIGDDDEYNAEMALKVPKTREAEFSYKGITVKLPESASQDMGTYRFRRDTEDLETLADDMRIIKFDKK
ncbi:uncharacterized protein [Drosophila pseudoobscura]|uniref:Uncharacterized protein isoform X3 n=1 Tax=Drosophila pseudoobscura pseudoobscura TaxID=46245 RepID=A0A6I8VZB4_DROPS|nr:uncharacterized protein LOC6903093 isoform X3 [Drosophila pseudoobscura]